MVKFQKRTIKRRYKNKERNYNRYLIELPVKLNQKIEPHKTKNFDEAEITTKETPTQEVVNISLLRNKTPNEPDKQKST